jgi:hypothetical protein
MNKLASVIAAAVLLSFAFAVPSRAAAAVPAKTAAGAAASSCDHDCLTGVVNQYLQALVAHDPAKLPVAPNIRFTENTIPLKLGDALWGTISALGDYKIYFADPQGGQAGIETTIRENGTPAILLLRLRVVNHRITEVETIVHRSASDAKALEAFGHPDPVWLQPLSASQRTPRQQMIKDANLYFDGILHSNGNMVPFDLRCNRVIDGDQDTNHPVAKGWFHKGSFDPDAMNIRDNMNTGIWSYVHSITPRHVVVVDEKMGIVVGMWMFNHPGRMTSVNVKGIGEVPEPSAVTHPSSVLMAEFFKIEAGKIRQIEGTSIALPYGAGTGWDKPAARESSGH